jgi:hypothetical protein
MKKIEFYLGWKIFQFRVNSKNEKELQKKFHWQKVQKTENMQSWLTVFQDVPSMYLKNAALTGTNVKQPFLVECRW